MRKAYRAPAATTALGLAILTGCTEQQDPNSLGEHNEAITGIVVEEGANIRQSPEFTNPDNSKRGLGIMVTKLTEDHIVAFTDSDDSSANSAVIETPEGVRTYEDHNKLWYGLDSKDIIGDACSTDIEVNPFDEAAYDKIEAARLECDRVTREFDGLGVVWVNEELATPVDSKN